MDRLALQVSCNNSSALISASLAVIKIWVVWSLQQAKQARPSVGRRRSGHGCTQRLTDISVRVQVRDLRKRVECLPDQYFVVLIGDLITEEALPTYMAMLNTLDGVRDETGAAPTPWGRCVLPSCFVSYSLHACIIVPRFLSRHHMSVGMRPFEAPHSIPRHHARYAGVVVC